MRSDTCDQNPCCGQTPCEASETRSSSGCSNPTNGPTTIREALADNQDNYKPLAWQQYTIDELGHWVHLFVKRAGHRSCPDKRAKDLKDARAYWLMMGEIMDSIENHAADGMASTF
jgi:hypothetical protein